ncbi:MAG: hypothetical protein J1F36_02210 [Clostridiales bacterium]|nr:hypothetical protein [Clostridiales bacterium]
MDEKKVIEKQTTLPKKPVPDKKAKEQREVENFKRKYFDYYDDIKISVREDW